MYQLTGIRVLAKEHESHQGWDPRFGVWEPELKRVSELRPSPVVSLDPELVQISRFAPPKINLLWRGPGSLGDSLGNVSFESVLALRELGLSQHLQTSLLSPWKVGPEILADARIPAFQQTQQGRLADPELEVQIPGSFPATASNCVRYFYEEFGHFSYSPTRAKDILWGASHFIGARLRSSFPENPVVTVPHGVNLSQFHLGVGGHTGISGEKFRFLYVGTTISRKGIDLLLKAFQQEKSNLPGAELVLKVFPTSSGFIWKEIYSQGEQVQVLDRPMPSGELAQLMRSCDVLVAPSRAEAFGMPVLEAMAVGLPVILPQGSAMQEFCPPECSWAVESEEVQVPISGKNIRFLEPNLDSLRRALQLAFESQAKLKEMGEKAAERAKLYSWENVTKLLLQKAIGT